MKELVGTTLSIEYDDLASRFKAIQLQKNEESLRFHHPLYRMEKAAIDKQIKEITKNFTVSGHSRNSSSHLEVAKHFENLGYKSQQTNETSWLIINNQEKVGTLEETFPTLKTLGLDEEEEFEVPYYRKCNFQLNDGTRLDAWINELGIRLGSRVRFKNDSIWWKVTNIGDVRLTEGQAKILERQV